MRAVLEGWLQFSKKLSRRNSSSCYQIFRDLLPMQRDCPLSQKRRGLAKTVHSRCCSERASCRRRCSSCPAASCPLSSQYMLFSMPQLCRFPFVFCAFSLPFIPAPPKHKLKSHRQERKHRKCPLSNPNNIVSMKRKAGIPAVLPAWISLGVNKDRKRLTL